MQVSIDPSRSDRRAPSAGMLAATRSRLSQRTPKPDHPGNRCLKMPFWGTHNIDARRRPSRPGTRQIGASDAPDSDIPGGPCPLRIERVALKESSGRQAEAGSIAAHDAASRSADQCGQQHAVSVGEFAENSSARQGSVGDVGVADVVVGIVDL